MKKIMSNGGVLHTVEKGDPAPAGAGRTPKTDIIKLMAEMLDGDGYTIVEGILLDENGASTGQKVKVRATVPNMQAAARAFMQNLKKGDTKTLQIFLDRTLGKSIERTEIEITTPENAKGWLDGNI